jgi:hypothetical protein
MPNESLTEHFMKYLVKSYSDGPDAAETVEIKFEVIGLPINADDVTDYSLSKLVNVYPQPDSAVFIRALQQLDSLYTMLLNSARLPAAVDDSPFVKMKAKALNNLTKCERAPNSSISILYHLSGTVPSDWYTDEKFWKTYDTAQSTSASDKNVAVKNDLVWKGGGEEGDPILDVEARSSAVQDFGPSTTKAPQISLKYCIIEIEREWLDPSLFTLFRNWFMPTMRRGQISESPVGFKYLPVAMIAVRELSISANWSAKDAAQIPKATALGPFSLADSTWSPENGELRNERTQIIGWICNPLPLLPPLSDPALTRVVRVTVERYVCEMSDDEGPYNDADMDRFSVYADAIDGNGTMIANNQKVHDWATSDERTMGVGATFEAGSSIDLSFNAENFDTAKLILRGYARDYDETSPNEEASNSMTLLGKQFFENGGKKNLYLYSDDFTFRTEITIAKVG